jgi:hypothetical protein
VDRQLSALESAADGAGKAVELVGDIVELVADTPLSRDGGGAKEKEPAVGLAQDALNQIKLLLTTIQEIVQALAPKEKRDNIATLIQTLAGLLASGTEAAIAGAIAALVEAIDSGATAKDIICVPGPNGEVTIWFRVRKGCLILFDFLVDDDYVYIHKTAKGTTPTFSTGESAEKIKKKVQEKLEKELEGAPASPRPVTPAPAPATPIPSTPAPTPVKPEGEKKFF